MHCPSCQNASVFSDAIYYKYRRDLPVPDTFRVHCRVCRVCGYNYTDWACVARTGDDTLTYSTRWSTIVNNITTHTREFADPRILDQQALLVKTPLADNHCVSVALVDQVNYVGGGHEADKNTQTPQWCIAIRKKFDHECVLWYLLRAPSVLGIVQFLTSLTDAQCASFLQRNLQPHAAPLVKEIDLKRFLRTMQPS